MLSQKLLETLKDVKAEFNQLNQGLVHELGRYIVKCYPELVTKVESILNHNDEVSAIVQSENFNMPAGVREIGKKKFMNQVNHFVSKVERVTSVAVTQSQEFHTSQKEDAKPVTDQGVTNNKTAFLTKFPAFALSNANILAEYNADALLAIANEFKIQVPEKANGAIIIKAIKSFINELPA